MLEIFGRSIRLSARGATHALPSAVAALCMIAVLAPATSSAVERKESPRLQELKKIENELEAKKDAIEKDRVNAREQREYRKTLLELRNVEKLIDREKLRSGIPRAQVFRERAQEEARERQKDAQERIDQRNALIKKKEQEQSANRGGVLINPDNQQPARSGRVIINPDNQKSAAPKPVIVNPDNTAVNRLSGSGTPINPDSQKPAGSGPAATGAAKAAGGGAPVPPRPTEAWRGMVR